LGIVYGLPNYGSCCWDYSWILETSGCSAANGLYCERYSSTRRRIHEETKASLQARKKKVRSRRLITEECCEEECLAIDTDCFGKSPLPRLLVFNNLKLGVTIRKLAKRLGPVSHICSEEHFYSSTLGSRRISQMPSTKQKIAEQQEGV
jgi:hypothetical protein